MYRVVPMSYNHCESCVLSTAEHLQTPNSVLQSMFGDKSRIYPFVLPVWEEPVCAFADVGKQEAPASVYSYCITQPTNKKKTSHSAQFSSSSASGSCEFLKMAEEVNST